MYRTLLTLAALLALGAVALSLNGCTTSYTHEGKKYVLLFHQTVDQPSNRVVRVTASTLRDLNMLNLSGEQTNLDGVFYAHTALGREFRIVVYGKEMQTTTIQVFGQEWNRDREQARLIMGELSDRLLRSELADGQQMEEQSKRYSQQSRQARVEESRVRRSAGSRSRIR